MSKKVEYNLDFYEALKIVMDGGCVKGDNFIDGIFLKLCDRGRLVIVDVREFYKEDPAVYIKGMLQQKFRSITVMTLRELSH
jgi:hypothetical protein